MASRTRSGSFCMAAAVVVAGLLTGLLAGCASEPTRLPVGTPMDEAIQRLGPPTARYTLPDGRTRLQYSRQPMGREVNDVDFGADGRMQSVAQVLDEKFFARDIRTDQWREADVLMHFGRPAMVSEVSSFSGKVWTWRYLWLNSPRFLHIFIDPSGLVRRYELADEPIREPDH